MGIRLSFLTHKSINVVHIDKMFNYLPEHWQAMKEATLLKMKLGYR